MQPNCSQSAVMPEMSWAHMLTDFSSVDHYGDP